MFQILPQKPQTDVFKMVAVTGLSWAVHNKRRFVDFKDKVFSSSRPLTLLTSRSNRDQTSFGGSHP